MSNEVVNGLSFGGVSTTEDDEANGVVTRRIVVLVGATVMLIRAFEGAGWPGNEGFPGRGALPSFSTKGSCFGGDEDSGMDLYGIAFAVRESWVVGGTA